jgi:hypothetical protein
MGVGGQCHAPATLPPGKTQYPFYSGPRAGLDRCTKSCPHQDSIPGLSSQQQVTIPTELSRPQSVQAKRQMCYTWKYSAFGLCHLVFHKYNTAKTMIPKLEHFKMNLFHLQVKQREDT